MMRAAFLAFQNFEHPSTRLNHETFEQEEALTRSTSPHRANACWALADIAMEPAWRQAIGKHEEAAEMPDEQRRLGKGRYSADIPRQTGLIKLTYLIFTTHLSAS